MLVSAGVGAAQQVPGATYSGTYVPSNGGFTLTVTHWALTDAGLVSWTGDSLDPPEAP